MSIKFYIIICYLFYDFEMQSRAVEWDNEIDAPVFRVVNGTPAKLGDIPYQISFKMKRKLSRSKKKVYRSFCGGTLVANKKIISAAHCFVLFSKSPFCDRGWGKAPLKCGNVFCTDFMSMGRIDETKMKGVYAVAGSLANVHTFKPKGNDSDTGQWRTLKNAWFPTRYKFPYRDIAVVTVHISFIYTPNVARINYTTIYKNYKGSCTASGYGRTGHGKKAKASDVLLHSKLELLSSWQCKKLHQREMSRFICTANANTDVEKGDSGGPLVCAGTGDPKEGKMGILVGVVSGAVTKEKYNRWRPRPKNNKRKTFFTRVSSYARFIAKSKSAYKTRINDIVLNFLCLLISHLLNIFLYW